MIYLDNAATTAPHQQVILEMVRVMTDFYGNPSSTYRFGQQVKKILEDSRLAIAQSLGALPEEIIFTSGGTESNTSALYALSALSKKRDIITSVVEHPSIRNVFLQFEQQGYTVHWLPVNAFGCVQIEDLKKVLTEQTAFVSIMAINNETGAKQPIEEIAQLLHEKNIPFHTDAVQAYGTMAFNLQKTPITMLSVSGHKIHGPKGVGALYVRKGTPFKPLFLGGNQEKGYRSGTENVQNIAGFAKATQMLNVNERNTHFEQLQQVLLDQLNAKGIIYNVNGSLDTCYKSAKIINLHFPNIPSSKLLIQLDLAGIMISAGSACSAGSLEPSRVLLAQYPSEMKRASESIRVSFSSETTTADIESFVENVARFTV